MKNFIHEDFLLQTDTAKYLYHEHAENLGIIDYHCHLNPKEIAENHQFNSITELWLGVIIINGDCSGQMVLMKIYYR